MKGPTEGWLPGPSCSECAADLFAIRPLSRIVRCTHTGYEFVVDCFASYLFKQITEVQSLARNLWPCGTPSSLPLEPDFQVLNQPSHARTAADVHR